MTIEKLKNFNYRNINLKKLTPAGKNMLLALFVMALVYFLFIQSDRYESVAKIIVNQARSSESSSGNFGVITTQRTKNEDTQLIIEYIKSVEMMEYLDYSIDLRSIYSNPKADFISRLPTKADKDQLFKFYLKHIKVKTSADNSILIIEVQSFDPEDSRKILEIIIRRSEEFINKIFNDVAKEQLDFIKDEVFAKEKRIIELQKKIHEAENKPATSDSRLINKNLERKLDFAIQAHKESLETLEDVRAESAQNLKKLVVITGPTVEIDASYPKRTYNILLFLSVFGLVYFITRSTYITVVTHRTK